MHRSCSEADTSESRNIMDVCTCSTRSKLPCNFVGTKDVLCPSVQGAGVGPTAPWNVGLLR
eukprot:12857693-Ditylum_brightwellii.AAC.1